MTWQPVPDHGPSASSTWTRDTLVGVIGLILLLLIIHKIDGGPRGQLHT